MIADALRAEIDSFAPEVERDNALYTGAEAGTLTPEAMAHYLHNVRHLIRHTPVFLTLARDRAASIGDDALAAYYAEKLTEEQGHDLWADADLKRLRGRFGADHADGIVPSLLRLLHFLDRTIEADPTLYLAYILFAEYHVVLFGPRWLELLETRCGLSRTMFTVIGNHAELDRHHVAEGLDAIDCLVADPEKLPLLREVLRTTMTLFQAICAEVVAREAVSDLGPWTTSSHA